MPTMDVAVTRELVLAARDALNLYDRLEAVREREPRLTTDQRAWLLWHHDSLYPAERGLATAIDNLQFLLGTDFPGRDVSDWKPICIQILSGELR